MPVSIASQPAGNSLNAAYRPIIISISGANPVVYCDVYFNGVYYKTISKTTGTDFDVQSAAQEFLKKFIALAGGSSAVTATPVITACFVRVRGSANDPLTNFLVPEGPVPVQGTDTVAPIAGGGSQSNTFYIINATLQHEDNQDLASHLNSFKTGSWDGSTYPLTHRRDGYRVNKAQSDYFPIVSNSSPGSLTLHYKLKSTGLWTSSGGGGGGGGGCVSPGISGSLPDGVQGMSYFYSIAATGTAPFSIVSPSKPSWMAITAIGSNITFQGTPNATGSASVSFALNNACGSAGFSDTINVSASCVAVGISGTPVLPDADVDTAYNYSFGLTGTAPFSIAAGATKPAWMTITISGSSVVFSGTPTSGDVATSVSISFTVNNACGTTPFSDTINVNPVGAHFGTTTFISDNELNDSQVANLVGTPSTTVTVTLETYTNDNGGQLQINGVAVTAVGETWDFVLDGSGTGSFTVDVFGVSGNPGSHIFGQFRITAVSSGTIGSPDIYQMSKLFTV